MGQPAEEQTILTTRTAKKPCSPLGPPLPTLLHAPIMWAPDAGAKLSCRLPRCHHFYLLHVQ